LNNRKQEPNIGESNHKSQNDVLIDSTPNATKSSTSTANLRIHFICLKSLSETKGRLKIENHMQLL